MYPLLFRRSQKHETVERDGKVTFGDKVDLVRGRTLGTPLASRGNREKPPLDGETCLQKATSWD